MSKNKKKTVKKEVTKTLESTPGAFVVFLINNVDDALEYKTKMELSYPGSQVTDPRVFCMGFISGDPDEVNKRIDFIMDFAAREFMCFTTTVKTQTLSTNVVALSDNVWPFFEEKYNKATTSTVETVNEVGEVENVPGYKDNTVVKADPVMVRSIKFRVKEELVNDLKTRIANFEVFEWMEPCMSFPVDEHLDGKIEHMVKKLTDEIYVCVAEQGISTDDLPKEAVIFEK